MLRYFTVFLFSVAVFAADDSRRDLSLIEAVKGQDTFAARALIGRHIDVNSAQADGATALHWAAYWDNTEVAELLIHAGANVNATNDLGVTPLFLACGNGSETMVSKLLAARAKVNITGPSGETPLMAAAHAGAAKAVALLLGHGADVNEKETSHGQTALMTAIAQKHPAVVKLLIEQGADVEARSEIRQYRGYTGMPTLQAGKNAEALVVPVALGGYTPLLFAAREGDVESGALLLAAKADVNETAPDGESVLVAASLSGQGQFAEFLLSHGADPKASGAGYTALHAAVMRDDFDLVKALLAHGADPNARVTKATPLPRESQHYVLPSMLVGATPWFLAAKFAEPEIMRILAASGADVQFTMPDGTTALMAAAGLGWPSQGNRRGALDVGTPTAEDERRGLKAVKVALEMGADVNSTDHAGNTAMHGAAAKGFSTIVQLLADKGAKLDVKNSRGLTPMASTPRPRESGSTAELLGRLGAKE